MDESYEDPGSFRSDDSTGTKRHGRERASSGVRARIHRSDELSICMHQFDSICSSTAMIENTKNTKFSAIITSENSILQSQEVPVLPPLKFTIQIFPLFHLTPYKTTVTQFSSFSGYPRSGVADLMNQGSVKWSIFALYYTGAKKLLFPCPMQMFAPPV